MKKQFKIKAGALQFVVFISVIIAVLLAAFLGLTHMYRFFKHRSYLVANTIHHADMGITYALIKDIPTHELITVPTPNSVQGRIDLYKDYWGVFEKVTATSRIKNTSFMKMALIGGQFSGEDRPALFMQDQHKPLLLVGHTYIEGLVYLPEKAVRSGNIAGKSYFREDLIYGMVKKSEPQLPSLPQELMVSLDALIAQRFEDASRMPITKDVLNRSFDEATSYFYNDDIIDLSGWDIRGNIVIASGAKVVVTADTKLRDVILTAPEIEIHDGVKGNFQAIASENISIGKGVELHYPSAVVLKMKATHDPPVLKKENQMYIDKNSTIKGIVMSYGEAAENEFSGQVLLQEESRIFGELYCNRTIVLYGAVYGTVYASDFRVDHLGTRYQNHIFNGTISSKQLPESYVGLILKASKKNIIQWLY